MAIPTAVEMGESLLSMVTTLTSLDLVPRAPNSLWRAISGLRSAGKTRTWRYEISKFHPIEFAPYRSHDLNVDLIPHVAGVVAVDERLERHGVPPFSELNVALEIWNPELGALEYRCHIDLANKAADGQYQPAPLFHIQFGGRGSGGDRANDPIREPRLNYFPTDVVLLCEAVVMGCFGGKAR